MNKNGLCREVGLIIIHFESVKPFLKYPPGGAGLKIHLREVYHDSELVSLETEDMTVGNVHVYLSDDAMSVCVRPCLCVHQYACTSARCIFFFFLGL